MEWKLMRARGERAHRGQVDRTSPVLTSSLETRHHLRQQLVLPACQSQLDFYLILPFSNKPMKCQHNALHKGNSASIEPGWDVEKGDVHILH